MKKIITILSLGILLTACGNNDNFQYHSKKEKETFIREMIKSNDMKMYKEYQTILADLKEKYKSGNENAKREFDEWDNVMDKVTNGAGYINIDDKNSGVMDFFNEKSESKF